MASIDENQGNLSPINDSYQISETKGEEAKVGTSKGRRFTIFNTSNPKTKKITKLFKKLLTLHTHAPMAITAVATGKANKKDISNALTYTNSDFKEKLKETKNLLKEKKAELKSARKQGNSDKKIGLKDKIKEIKNEISKLKSVVRGKVKVKDLQIAAYLTETTSVKGAIQGVNIDLKDNIKEILDKDRFAIIKSSVKNAAMLPLNLTKAPIGTIKGLAKRTHTIFKDVQKATGGGFKEGIIDGLGEFESHVVDPLKERFTESNAEKETQPTTPSVRKRGKSTMRPKEKEAIKYAEDKLTRYMKLPGGIKTRLNKISKEWNSGQIGVALKSDKISGKHKEQLIHNLISRISKRTGSGNPIQRLINVAKNASPENQQRIFSAISKADIPEGKLVIESSFSKESVDEFQVESGKQELKELLSAFKKYKGLKKSGKNPAIIYSKGKFQVGNGNKLKKKKGYKELQKKTMEKFLKSTDFGIKKGLDKTADRTLSNGRTLNASAQNIFDRIKDSAWAEETFRDNPELGEKFVSSILARDTIAPLDDVKETLGTFIKDNEKTLEGFAEKIASKSGESDLDNVKVFGYNKKMSLGEIKTGTNDFETIKDEVKKYPSNSIKAFENYREGAQTKLDGYQKQLSNFPKMEENMSPKEKTDWKREHSNLKNVVTKYTRQVKSCNQSISELKKGNVSTPLTTYNNFVSDKMKLKENVQDGVKNLAKEFRSQFKGQDGYDNINTLYKEVENTMKGSPINWDTLGVQLQTLLTEGNKIK